MAADGARDALLIVLAYRLVAGRPIDPRYRITGDRAVSDYLGRQLLPDLGIAGVKSALEGRSFSHGYLSAEVRRSVLRDTAPIVSDPAASDDEIALMFHTLARGIASTAKRFEALPALDLDAMTFPRALALVSCSWPHDQVARAAWARGREAPTSSSWSPLCCRRSPTTAACRCEWSPRA